MRAPSPSLPVGGAGAVVVLTTIMSHQECLICFPVQPLLLCNVDARAFHCKV